MEPLFMILPRPVPDQPAVYISCPPPPIKEIAAKLGRTGPWFASSFYCVLTNARVEAGKCLLTFTPMDLMWGHFKNPDGSIGEKIPLYGPDPVEWSDWLPLPWKQLRQADAERYFDSAA